MSEADADPWRIERFVRAHSSLADRTVQAYASDVRLFAEWASRAAVTSPADVNRTLVRRYVAHLSTREFARRSIARKAAAIRRYFLWAVEEGLAAADPTIGLNVAGGSGRLPRVLDGRELGQLLYGAAPDGEPGWRVVLTTTFRPATPLSTSAMPCAVGT